MTTLEAATAAFRVKDWTAFATYFADDAVLSDKRPILRVDLEGKEKVLEYFRPTGDMANTTVTQTMIASRGERLAIRSLVYQGSGGDIGPSEFSALDVIEVNDDGRVINFIRYTQEDSDEAYAELDRRYYASEAKDRKANQQQFREAIAKRDWEAVKALAAPEFVEEYHRPLAVLGTRHGPESWAETIRALVELAPDTQIRLGQGCSLNHATFHGSREDGHYEMPFITVAQYNADGLLIHHDLYEPEQIDTAAARFEELANRASTPPNSMNNN